MSSVLWIERAPTPVRWFIVDASAITDVDYSAAESIREFIGELKRQDVQIVFARVTPYLRSDMDRHHITDALGGQWIFSTLHEAIAVVQARSAATTSTEGADSLKK